MKTTKQKIGQLIIEHLDKKIEKELNAKTRTEGLDQLADEKILVLAKIEDIKREEEQGWTYEKSNPSSTLQ
jgi:hypothetical protein